MIISEISYKIVNDALCELVLEFEQVSDIDFDTLEDVMDRYFKPIGCSKKTEIIKSVDSKGIRYQEKSEYIDQFWFIRSSHSAAYLKDMTAQSMCIKMCSPMNKCENAMREITWLGLQYSDEASDVLNILKT